MLIDFKSYLAEKEKNVSPFKKSFYNESIANPFAKGISYSTLNINILLLKIL